MTNVQIVHSQYANINLVFIPQTKIILNLVITLICFRSLLAKSSFPRRTKFSGHSFSETADILFDDRLQ